MNKLFYTNYEQKFDNIRKLEKKPFDYRDLIVHFENPNSLAEFNNIIGCNITKSDTELYYNGLNKSINKLFINSDRFENYIPKTVSSFEKYNNMPEYISSDMSGYHKIIVHFNNKLSLDKFLSLINQSITEDTKYIWYPKQKLISRLDYIYDSDIQQQFPIYIISKGRWDTSYTARNLNWMGIENYYIIVEEQEYNNYRKRLGEEHLLILDKKYQQEYETCDPEGDLAGLPVGSGAARNFGWEHSIKNGYKYHWMMDDNIYGFYRLNKNKAYRVKSGAFFRVMEDYVLRYDNIAMAGPQYTKFIPYKDLRKPLEWNTRLYSCNLIRNDIPFRWRCRYNEDTDLSLRILKAGYATVQFVPFLQDKATTQTVKGGNTSEIYQVGTGIKSRALARLHPDVTEVVYKYNREHHYVDYSRFINNNPKLKNNIKYSEDTEYGMKLVYTGDKENINVRKW